MPDSKSVVVTGASRGIGRCCAIALADAGFEVYAGVRTEQAAEELCALGKPSLRSVPLDICDAKSIASLLSSLSGKRIYGLVNNAGTAVLGPMEFLPIDEIRQEFEVNVFGQIAMIQALLPKLREAKGRIVNIGSISGFIGFPYFGAYSASKFALEGLSDSLRRELKQFGVSVSVIQPGNIDTDIWRDSFAKGKSLEDQFPEAAIKTYGKRFRPSKTGNYGPAQKSSPSLVAEAVLRAMKETNPAARYIVGRDAKRYRRFRTFLPDKLLDKFV